MLQVRKAQLLQASCDIKGIRAQSETNIEIFTARLEELKVDRYALESEVESEKVSADAARRRVKKFEQQIRIAKEVMHSRKLSADIHSLVKGLMIESYIEDGCQKVGEGIYGKSITDPCLGWASTEKLIYEIADYE